MKTGNLVCLHTQIKVIHMSQETPRFIDKQQLSFLTNNPSMALFQELTSKLKQV